MLAVVDEHEVKVRPVASSGVAEVGDGLTAPYCLTRTDHQIAVVGVGGNPAVRMLDHHEVAVPLDLIPRVSDDAPLRGSDIRADRASDVDRQVVARPAASPASDELTAAHRLLECSGHARIAGGDNPRALGWMREELLGCARTSKTDAVGPCRGPNLLG